MKISFFVATATIFLLSWIPKISAQNHPLQKAIFYAGKVFIDGQTSISEEYQYQGTAHGLSPHKATEAAQHGVMFAEQSILISFLGKNAELKLGFKNVLLAPGRYPLDAALGVMERQHIMSAFTENATPQGSVDISYFSEERIKGTFQVQTYAMDQQAMMSAAAAGKRPAVTPITIRGSFDCGVVKSEGIAAPNDFVFGKKNEVNTTYVERKLDESKIRFKLMDTEMPESLIMLQRLLEAMDVQKNLKKIIYPVIFYSKKFYFRKEGESIEKFTKRFMEAIKK